ncbi:MAG: DNA replication and repair protein RecF [Spirochaetales bacterium]
MPFLSVSFSNFRNLKESMVDILAKEVFFVGENGQGKTNLLECLYISSYGSSFRTRFDTEIINKEKDNYFVRGFFRGENEKTDMISVQYSENKKKILKNGKKITDRKELINTVPCVLFSHDDLDFITGEPERRRFFIDQSLSMYDILYIDTLRKYKKILKSRNIILKEEKYDMLDVYDESLIYEGREIVKKRNEAIYQFNRIFTPLYEEVTGIQQVKIKYDSQWYNKKSEEIFDILSKKRPSDKIMKTTLSGPHRDRISFVRENKPFVPTSSTGQKRILSVLLRICQAVHYTHMSQKKPVLLMDDVLLEIDLKKREKITRLLPEYDQLFCTFLPDEPYEKYKKENTRIYNVVQGEFYEQ